MLLSALFEQFVKFLRVEKEATAGSIATYRFCFNDFQEFVRQSEGRVLVTHFTIEACRAYQYMLNDRQLAPDTIRLRLATLSSFGKWALREQKLRLNPTDQLTRPRRKIKLPRVPRFTAVESWLSNGIDWRTKAMIALMTYGGLRRGELVALDVGDYDSCFGLRRVKGKGGDEAGVALPECARKILDAYLTERNARPEAPMFVVHYRTRGNREVERRMLDKRVTKIIKAFGVREGAPELHPHAFRHACGVELLKLSGGNLRAVQQHLRHADIQTTTIYTRLAQPELSRIVEAFDRGVSTPPTGA